MINDQKLLPCPFCNSSTMPGVEYAQCSNSACPAFHIRTKDLRMWNTRAAQPQAVEGLPDLPPNPFSNQFIADGFSAGCRATREIDQAAFAVVRAEVKDQDETIDKLTIAYDNLRAELVEELQSLRRYINGALPGFHAVAQIDAALAKHGGQS